MTERSENGGILSFFADRPFLKWFQQPKFCAAVLILILLTSIVGFPQKISRGETLPGTGKICIFAVIFLCIIFLVCILTNVDIPERYKNLCTLIVVLFFGWMIYAFSGTDWDLMRRQFFNFEKMKPCWKVLFNALGITLKIGFSCFVLVPVIGFLFGLLRSFNNPIFNFFISAYVTVFRSIPDTVLIVLVYFALPYVGIKFESTTAVIVALTLLYSAYATEVFRSGISSVGKVQREASAALGMTFIQTMMYVVMPQAIRIVIPPLTSLLVGILKSTSIASIAAAPEMMTRAKQLMGTTASATPLIAVSVIYFMIIAPLVVFSMQMEKRAKKYKK